MEVSIYVDVPDGYRVVDYRLPKEGERFLDQYGNGRIAYFDFAHEKHFILEPVEPAEDATAKFLGGLGDEIKGVAETVERLTERVASLEQAKEAEPEQWGLWGKWPDEKECRWHTKTYKTADAAHNWRTRHNDATWAVYPYPADDGPPLELRDGGKPLELRELKLPELWGVWFTDLNRWAGLRSFKAVTLFCSKDEAIEFCKATTHAEPRILPIEELINA